MQCVDTTGNLPCNAIAGSVLDRGQDSAPLTASARLDKLLHEYEEFFEGDKTFGPPLQTDLAGLINKALRRKPSDEKLKKLMATYKTPENIPCLNVPVTNKEVQQGLHKGANILDINIRKAQAALAKGLVPILTWLHDFKTSKSLFFSPTGGTHPNANWA